MVCIKIVMKRHFSKLKFRKSKLKSIELPFSKHSETFSGETTK